MFDTTDIEVIGVVFDLGHQHGSNGLKNIDNVKKHLIDFVRRNLDEDDMFYVYKPDIIEPTNRIGANVASISNYRTDGWKFDVRLALQQTLYIVASEPCERKTVVLITDRLSDADVLKSINKLNQKDDLRCNLICIDIGEHLSNIVGVEITHVEDSANLEGVFEEAIYAS